MSAPSAFSPRRSLWLAGAALVALVAIVFWPRVKVIAPAQPARHPSAPLISAPLSETVPPPPAVVETASPPAPVAMLPEQVAALVAVLASSSADPAQAAGPLINAAYAPLFQQLNLGTADITAMDALLARRLDTVKDALADVAAQGLTLANDRAQITQAARDAVAPVEADIKSLLGDAGYAQYQTYATPLRTAVVTALLRARAAQGPQP